jgi:hypothetical protein
MVLEVFYGPARFKVAVEPRKKERDSWIFTGSDIIMESSAMIVSQASPCCRST